jgi:hypothetical protein
MPAYFSVQRVFHLTGTGPVVAGHILEGVIRSGMLAAIDDRPDLGPWQIGDVGFADNVALGKRYVLLTFPTVLLVDDLCTALPLGSVLTINHPDP